jgi:hypothetical protein
MALKKINGEVKLVPGKRPKFGAQPIQYNVNCDDMRKVQSALLLKPRVPFFQRKEV